MKDWREKIEKELGRTKANYVYGKGKAVLEFNPHPVLAFFDEASFAAAIHDKNVLERMFPNVVLTCRNYSAYSDNKR